MKPIIITDENFEDEVIHSGVPVVIDFWAVWCAPCRLITPIMEELAESYDGKVKIGKLDVDSNQQTAIKFGVRSIPTVLFFKNGKLKDSLIGAGPKRIFVEKLENLINQ